jgi:hypothetical protein
MYKKLQDLFYKTVNFPPLKWYRNILYALDQLVNAILLGDPRETVSSVLGKMKDRRNCKLCGYFCKVLSLIFFEPNHCIRSINHTQGMDHSYNNMSVVKRRGWGNFFVILVILVLVFRNEILDFINLIV